MFYRMHILAFTFLTSCVTISSVIAPDTPRPWSNGVIPYYLDEDLPKDTKDNIIRGMSAWEEATGIIKFVKGSEEENVVIFEDNDEGCSAYVGMQGSTQTVSLSTGCDYSTVLHELGHVIGLRHEHQRPDRDRYITVDWDQIASSFTTAYNFRKYPRKSYPKYLGPYDYDSIMHYDAYDFSDTGGATIIFKDGKSRNYFYRDITVLDILKVKKLYEDGNP